MLYILIHTVLAVEFVVVLWNRVNHLPCILGHAIVQIPLLFCRSLLFSLLMRDNCACKVQKLSPLVYDLFYLRLAF